MKKMLTESKKLNIAIILLVIFDALWIYTGILYASSGFMPYHEEMIGMTINQVGGFNESLKVLLMFVIRYNGFLFIHNGIMGLYVLYVGFQKKEKWAWTFVLLSGILSLFPLMGLFIGVAVMYGSDFITFITTAPVPNVIIIMIPWIVALGISYKEFLE